mgnify:CR=1 FL=1
MPPEITKEKCNKCGICADICPMHVISMKKGKEYPDIKYQEECWHCNACVLDCPQEAVNLRIPLPAMMLYMDAKRD